jgi:hypothetical protein
MFLKNRAITAAFSTIFALGFVSAATSVKAGYAPQKFSCTNSTLQGDYASSATGFVNGSTPFNLVYLDRFDGNGNITGVKGATSTGGQVSENLSDSGTYQVNSDCTVSLTFVSASGSQSTNFGVIADRGRKIYVIGTGSGGNISSIFEKVNR